MHVRRRIILLMQCKAAAPVESSMHWQGVNVVAGHLVYLQVVHHHTAAARLSLGTTLCFASPSAACLILVAGSNG